jgi:hypothetical protein
MQESETRAKHETRNMSSTGFDEHHPPSSTSEPFKRLGEEVNPVSIHPSLTRVSRPNRLGKEKQMQHRGPTRFFSRTVGGYFGGRAHRVEFGRRFDGAVCGDHRGRRRQHLRDTGADGGGGTGIGTRSDTGTGAGSDAGRGTATGSGRVIGIDTGTGIHADTDSGIGSCRGACNGQSQTRRPRRVDRFVHIEYVIPDSIDCLASQDK